MWCGWTYHTFAIYILSFTPLCVMHMAHIMLWPKLGLQFACNIFFFFFFLSLQANTNIRVHIVSIFTKNAGYIVISRRVLILAKYINTRDTAVRQESTSYGRTPSCLMILFQNFFLLPHNDSCPQDGVAYRRMKLWLTIHWQISHHSLQL